MSARQRAAVIGLPVAHSLSPVLHRAAYSALGLDGWQYERRETRPEQLGPLLAELAAPAGPGPVWAGLSVTMPHKQALLTRLDALDPLAQTVGAANTVVAQRSGRGPALLTGFNTDVAGIVGALREAGRYRLPDPADLADATALVLGSGATACSALAALTELGAGRIVVAARSHAGPGRALAAAHRMGLEVEAVTWRPGDPASDAAVAGAMSGADLAVSTLPAHGPDLLAPLVRRVRPGAPLLDVTYEPWPTALAAAWQEAGGLIVPGWLMLLHQAVPQVRLMTGMTPDVDAMRTALLRALARR
ncbi:MULTISPECIES: shikimate dehydrogenase [unclassified Actinomyces]|uniref:shikimate dehydrogenase n=1 Tax=unclassified Actinomyces TaxID=2609248 RepID=UPI002017690A|nr:MULTISPECIES: shikimate dehydrogenase [unclassified Actinomyces]MCL3778321.1 shikimate dehydrogenase [Actinomyces sp. AC-20-1]MCL3789214.1 shikimate dehydrogenase [Actinomyces sp. 187325]MCL3791401.1 shikimate dehydrogenase [Actinomyces sp. 186855]MCL3793574.1 shikimate dehydrogenase [Actinomyces sp. 217892]